MPGKAGSVEERGGQHLLAQRGTQGGQTPQVCRVYYGFCHIIVVIFGDPVSQSGVMSNTFSYVRKEAIPVARNSRYPHPQPFDAGGSTRVGEKGRG